VLCHINIVDQESHAYPRAIVVVTGMELIQPTSLLRALIHLNLKLFVRMEAFGKTHVRVCEGAEIKCFCLTLHGMIGRTTGFQCLSDVVNH
jgi:hypothetical protein